MADCIIMPCWIECWIELASKMHQLKAVLPVIVLTTKQQTLASGATTCQMSLSDQSIMQNKNSV